MLLQSGTTRPCGVLNSNCKPVEQSMLSNCVSFAVYESDQAYCDPAVNSVTTASICRFDSASSFWRSGGSVTPETVSFQTPLFHQPARRHMPANPIPGLSWD